MSALQFNLTSENLFFFFNVAGEADKRTSVVSLMREILASSALIQTSLKIPPKIFSYLHAVLSN